MIGPTKSGKTTLAKAILPRRKHVVVAATKPRDPLIDDFRAEGYRVARDWPEYGERILLWPRHVEMAKVIPHQRDVIGRMLASVYKTGAWTVYLDETRFVTDYLRLSREVELLWLQGRAMGVTLVAGAQRPRHLPLAAYSQASHLYVWRTRDRSDLKRLADISGAFDLRQIEATVATLPQHHCLFIDADGGSLRVTAVG